MHFCLVRDRDLEDVLEMVWKESIKDGKDWLQDIAVDKVAAGPNSQRLVSAFKLNSRADIPDITLSHQIAHALGHSRDVVDCANEPSVFRVKFGFEDGTPGCWGLHNVFDELHSRTRVPRSSSSAEGGTLRHRLSKDRVGSCSAVFHSEPRIFLLDQKAMMESLCIRKRVWSARLGRAPAARQKQEAHIMT